MNPVKARYLIRRKDGLYLALEQGRSFLREYGGRFVHNKTDAKRFKSFSSASRRVRLNKDLHVLLEVEV